MAASVAGASTARRLLTLVTALVIIGAPAAALRALCVGHSCDAEEDPSSEVPFCSLPTELRKPIAAGFESELHRSPDLLAVTKDYVVTGGTGFSPEAPAPRWPSIEPISRRVPLVFTGPGVAAEAKVPDHTTLDAVAPTLADAIGFQRPNPQVRSGRPIEDVVGDGPVRLVVTLALKGVGSRDLEESPEAWPNLRNLMDRYPGTLDADAGSLPLDPTAVMTTLGTGGLPNQHGIVGTLVRNNEGKVVRAWGPGAQLHIIATLADDLDEELGQDPLVGLVRTEVSDGGLVGGDWYVDVDKDDVVTERRNPDDELAAMLNSGYGEDEVPDVIGVALEGSFATMDERIDRIEKVLARKADSWVMAIAGTGSLVDPQESDLSGRRVGDALVSEVSGADEVISAVTPGGLYLDQEALAKTGLTEDDVLAPLASIEGPGDRSGALMADAFSAIAVSFARYC